MGLGDVLKPVGATLRSVEAARRRSRLAGIWLSTALVAGVLMGCGTPFGGGCPAALLAGELAEKSGDLVVVADGFVERVDWQAAGFQVRRDGDELVVGQPFGATARAGDRVHIGGGEQMPGICTPCGDFVVTDQ